VHSLHTYIRTYIHTYIYSFIHTYIHTYARTHTEPPKLATLNERLDKHEELLHLIVSKLDSLSAMSTGPSPGGGGGGGGGGEGEGNKGVREGGRYGGVEGGRSKVASKLLSANLLAGMYADVCHTHTNPTTNLGPHAHKHHDKVRPSDCAPFARIRSLDSLRARYLEEKGLLSPTGRKARGSAGGQGSQNGQHLSPEIATILVDISQGLRPQAITPNQQSPKFTSAPRSPFSPQAQHQQGHSVAPLVRPSGLVSQVAADSGMSAYQ